MDYRQCSVCHSYVDDGGWLDSNYKYWVGIMCGCDDCIDKETQILLRKMLDDENKTEKDKQILLKSFYEILLNLFATKQIAD